MSYNQFSLNDREPYTQTNTCQTQIHDTHTNITVDAQTIGEKNIISNYAQPKIGE